MLENVDTKLRDIWSLINVNASNLSEILPLFLI